jgi:hypothetical protein
MEKEIEIVLEIEELEGKIAPDSIGWAYLDD